MGKGNFKMMIKGRFNQNSAVSRKMKLGQEGGGEESGRPTETIQQLLSENQNRLKRVSGGNGERLILTLRKYKVI